VKIFTTARRYQLNMRFAKTCSARPFNVVTVEFARVVNIGVSGTNPFRMNTSCTLMPSRVKSVDDVRPPLMISEPFHDSGGAACRPTKPTDYVRSRAIPKPDAADRGAQFTTSGIDDVGTSHHGDVSERATSRVLVNRSPDHVDLQIGVNQRFEAGRANRNGVGADVKAGTRNVPSPLVLTVISFPV